jgi:hypothetical protein
MFEIDMKLRIYDTSFKIVEDPDAPGVLLVPILNMCDQFWVALYGGHGGCI